MKKNLFVFLLITTTISYGQDYYIDNNKDTIRGKAQNYKEWSRTPGPVSFKQDASGSLIELTPASCKILFIAPSDFYISYYGTRVANSESVNDNRGTYKSDELRRDTVHVFLRELYRHNSYVLYKLFDNKRTNFYLSKDGAIRELEYYEYLNGESQIIPFNSYKQNLLVEFSGESKDLEQQVVKLKYNESSLVSFLAKIFKDEPNVSESRRNKYPVETFVAAGALLSSGRIKNDAGESSSSFSSNPVSPSIEIGFRIYSQRNFGRSFFQPTINYSSFTHKFSSNTPGELRAKGTLLSAHLSAGYFFKKRSDLDFYGALGGGMSLLINYNTSLTNGSYYKKIEADNVLNKLIILPEFGVVVKKSLNIAVTGTIPFKLPLYSNLNYKYTIGQIGVMVRYVFVKKKARG